MVEVEMTSKGWNVCMDFMRIDNKTEGTIMEFASIARFNIDNFFYTEVLPVLIQFEALREIGEKKRSYLGAAGRVFKLNRDNLSKLLLLNPHMRPVFKVWVDEGDAAPEWLKETNSNVQK